MAQKKNARKKVARKTLRKKALKKLRGGFFDIFTEVAPQRPTTKTTGGG